MAILSTAAANKRKCDTLANIAGGAFASKSRQLAKIRCFKLSLMLLHLHAKALRTRDRTLFFLALALFLHHVACFPTSSTLRRIQGKSLVVIQEYLERFQHQAFVESKSPDVSQDFKHLCCTPLQLPKAFVKKSITRLV